MKTIIVLAVCLLFVSCKKEIKKVEIKSDSIVEVSVDTLSISDNSQNSLDWSGTYKGITPCADCEGIETQIVLNKDLTYTLKTKYLGKGDGKVFQDAGSFVWDKSGGNITLEGLKGSPSQYKVGENKLIQLDMNGQLITGAFSEKYVLKK